MKDYVKRYSSRRSLVPPEHVLVFDEAQRAFDEAMMKEKHGPAARSEPEEFIGFAERIPEWCVVIGLIGTGQEIHVGEEGGLTQWKRAVELSPRSAEWTVHAPPSVARLFAGGAVPLESRPALSLDTELRYHQARDLHRYVAELLEGAPARELQPLARQLNEDGLHLRITRSLDTARDYLRERYHGDVQARFGLVASSKDRDLAGYGVPNDWVATQKVKVGPWYGDDETSAGGHSCRHLESCVTEFGAQGLELDATLLAWGTDLVRSGGRWCNDGARGYQKRALVRDAYQLRVNAYRVLLTRGRDACIVFVPPLHRLDETYTHLVAAGFLSLEQVAGRGG